MIGEWISPYIQTVFLKCQSSRINQALDLVLEGHTLPFRMHGNTTMIGACCIMIVPSGKRRLVDLLGAFHIHLVAD